MFIGHVQKIFKKGSEVFGLMSIFRATNPPQFIFFRLFSHGPAKYGPETSGFREKVKCKHTTFD